MLTTDIGRARMNIGVLMIGSLYWDCARIEWRGARLVEANPKRVRVPIRYGRRSSKRGGTYTMVFSAGLERDKFGQAIVLACRQRVSTVEQLWEEATRLWAAERKCKRTESICRSWGCVALLPNPKRELPQGFIAGWKSRVAGQSGYPRLEPAKGERAAVSEGGILNIPWPQLLDGKDLEFDALLGTATNPTINNGDYPSAEAIASAWTERRGKEHIEYFHNNVSNGITTWQDRAIKCWFDQPRRTQ